MSLPPYMIRMIPGIGMALTGAYVGWKIYEHVNQTSILKERQRIKEQSLSLQHHHSNHINKSDDDEEINRPQLCEWLGLPSDALDFVPNEQLPLILEALSNVPPPARLPFLEVFCNKLLVLWGSNCEKDDESCTLLESNLQSWIHLLGAMTSHEIEKFVVILTQIHEEAHFIVLARCLRHVLQLDGRLGDEGEYVNDPSPADGKTGLFLNQLYVLWNLNALEFLLKNLHDCPPQQDPELEELTEPANTDIAWQDVLDLMLAISEHGGACSLQLFVQQWQRLVVDHSEEDDPFGDNSNSSLSEVPHDVTVRGYLNSLTISLQEQTKEEGARFVIRPSSHNAQPQGQLLTTTRLLQKYNTLSDQRFRQVTVCCAKFAKPQVNMLLQSLVAATGKDEQHTSSSSLSSSSSSSLSSSSSASLLPHSEETPSMAGSTFSLLSVPHHDKLD